MITFTEDMVETLLDTTIARIEVVATLHKLKHDYMFLP